ncbi:antA/AntB antirepressor family protein [Nostoc sp. CHAB 5824]|nr:antA/AntB antirepressor family protein [Nostoc sp. CHAB 5824]
MTIPTFDESLASSLYESDDLFPIDLDDAWQWLGYTKKQTCLDNLKDDFTDGVDFLRAGIKSSGGRPSEVYLLSVDCFKTLGMMAGTKQGKIIRGYFLKCERELRDATTKAPPQLPSSEDREINQLCQDETVIARRINELKKALTHEESKLEVIQVKKARLYVQKHSSIIEEAERCKQIITKFNPYMSKISIQK